MRLGFARLEIWVPKARIGVSKARIWVSYTRMWVLEARNLGIRSQNLGAKMIELRPEFRFSNQIWTILLGFGLFCMDLG